MDWLSDNKIPLGDWAEAVFDWVNDNFAWFFDWLSEVLEAMIDGILWVLQTPPEIVVIAAFVALTWVLQRRWQVCLLVLAQPGVGGVVPGDEEARVGQADEAHDVGADQHPLEGARVRDGVAAAVEVLDAVGERDAEELVELGLPVEG